MQASNRTTTKLILAADASNLKKPDDEIMSTRERQKAIADIYNIKAVGGDIDKLIFELVAAECEKDIPPRSVIKNYNLAIKFVFSSNK